MLKLTDPKVVSSRVLCIGEPGELADEVVALGVPLACIMPACGPKSPAAVVIGSPISPLWGRCDTHTWSVCPSVWVARLLHLLARCPLVHTKHGYLWPWTRAAASAEPHCRTAVARTWLPSREDLANYLREAEKLPDRKLRLVYNGIDLSRFQDSEIRKYSSAPIAVMVSRLSTEKDFETLFRAVAIVAAAASRFRAAIDWRRTDSQSA